MDMEFTRTELYFWLPLAFLYGYSLHAMYKLMRPIDALYQKYTRRNQATNRRRLSILGETSSQQITDLNIHNSRFLGKLPTEIRQAIYEIYHKNSRFVLTREGVLPSKHIAWMHDKDWRYLREDPGISRIYVQRGVLSLPLTCRQIYVESINYVYSMPQFECFGLNDALELPQILLPQRWQVMTSFHFWIDVSQIMGNVAGGRLREWKGFWQALSKLPYLKRLEVHLNTGYGFLIQHEGGRFFTQAICDQVLHPLWMLSNIPEFEVYLNRRSTSMEKYISAPFRLSWHEEPTPQKPRVLMHLGENGEFVSCEHNGKCCRLRF